MCGIIGIASNKPVSINIINSLKKLEYRVMTQPVWQQSIKMKLAKKNVQES